MDLDYSLLYDGVLIDGLKSFAVSSAKTSNKWHSGIPASLVLLWDCGTDYLRL